MRGWGVDRWGDQEWGSMMPAPERLPVVRTNSPLNRPKRPHVKADSPGVYRRKK